MHRIESNESVIRPLYLKLQYLLSARFIESFLDFEGERTTHSANRKTQIYEQSSIHLQSRAVFIIWHCTNMFPTTFNRFTLHAYSLKLYRHNCLYSCKCFTTTNEQRLIENSTHDSTCQKYLQREQHRHIRTRNY